MSESIVRRRWWTASGAIVAELAAHVTPQWLFERLATAGGTLFLDGSADVAESRSGFMAGLARHSFVAADPIGSIEFDDAAAAGDAVAAIRTALAASPVVTIPGLPPFQGGVAGLLSYEFGLGILGVRPPDGGGLGRPAVKMHVYDVVAGFDHEVGGGWIISQGVPAVGPKARGRRAEERLARWLALVEAGSSADPREPAGPRSSGRDGPPEAAVHPVMSGRFDLRSTHSREAHMEMVRRGIEYVRAGDMFQVNLAQRLFVPTACDPVELHRVARRVNAAPFSASFDLGRAGAIVSSSPERFLQVRRGEVRMHPIKGTRRMTRRPEADLFAGDDLGASEKDRAENVMIVDLVRNDLSRVCRPESVRVEALCRLERYAYVQHLVSVVAGRLATGNTALDAVVAAVPAGSVTGAPKHRACEIISELEGVERGPYCGSLGYLGFDGTADFNLLIRTFVATPSGVTFAVGGGITAASDPAAEYDETLHKAEGMLRVLEQVLPAGASPAWSVRP